MKVGVLIHLDGRDVDKKIKKVAEFGFDSCQVACWNHSLLGGELAQRVNRACETYGVKISTVWVGYSGPSVWNFSEGPTTIGIVPKEHREYRVKELMHGSDFAKMLGVNQIATHFGFLPESPCDPQYIPILSSICEVADYCKANGQHLLFETGQETPVTILRFIEDSGRDNLGVNFDPANLILYGKANPIDAVGILGKYIRDVHAKDGNYPTNGRELGKEAALGKGCVNFPAFIERLRAVGYDGALTIEREIEGEQQEIDILFAKAMLEELI